MIEKWRHRVAIQDPVVATNARGVDKITAYSTAATVYAKITSLSGREQQANDQVTPVATHQVEIRYRSGVTTKQRLKWGTRYFSIVSVLENDNRLRTLTLQCNEIVGTDRAI